MRKRHCEGFNRYYSYGVTEGMLCCKRDVGEEGCFSVRGAIGGPLTIEKERRIFRIDVLIGALIDTIRSVKVKLIFLRSTVVVLAKARHVHPAKESAGLR